MSTTSPATFRATVESRLKSEIGTLYKEAPERVAMLYPSPYATGMSSLGFQTIYRQINETPGRAAERAFLPDSDDERFALVTYESLRPVSEHRVIAISVAYELELAGVIKALELCGIPALAEHRDERHPFILCGGPLTFSNPLPLAPFADAIILGEAEQTVQHALAIVFGSPSNEQARAELARTLPSCFVPAIHGTTLGEMGKVDDALLPAFAPIRTPNTELRDMFLLEAERGCSRGCTYCVMRRSTNGGMRIVPKEKILSLIPQNARRIGLVGAAVSDHPHIAEIVETLADQGREVGLSSLRPDRLNDRFVAALARAGYRTLTTASDGASQRLRDGVQRKARENHLLRAAQLARTHKLHRLKLYMMIGLPDEEDADIDELIAFSTELSKIIPLSLGIAPFVSKRNTPLDGKPFAGIRAVEDRLKRLRRGVQGRVDIRSTSAKWAWVEHVLAQGGPAQGRAVLQAVRGGGRFAAWKDAFLERLPFEGTAVPMPAVATTHLPVLG